ncbi:protein phosphatase 1 regulatory subunit 35 [Clupea harengus]|uniref:Protein phosphatase 1 regulatory subunit 35 n=1 Tax=Clupea harengus TaxID=7950 RepID=A0A6P8GQ65_CLUHA|nr:protein phosphatase 1 regulatory subunit 35 [Clupea harengus]
MTMLQRPFAGFGDPDSQPAPLPGPTAACHGTPLRKCPELDLSITSTPERPPADSGILRRSKGPKQKARQVRFDVRPKPKATSPHRACPVNELPVVTVIQEPSCTRPAASQPAVSERKGKKKEKRAGQDRCITPPLAETGDGQLLEGAQLNSTLHLKAALEKVTLEEFDPQKAMKEKLQTSTHTKNQISAKAAEGVNFRYTQQLYHGLVSVSLSHEQLVSQALRHRPPLALPVRSHGNKAQSEAPDLLAFYSPGELLRESPLLPGNQVPLPRPRPKPRPAHATFDLYQRQRQWEA